jgi:signal transduction histidine kinase
MANKLLNAFGLYTIEQVREAEMAGHKECQNLFQQAKEIKWEAEQILNSLNDRLLRLSKIEVTKDTMGVRANVVFCKVLADDIDILNQAAEVVKMEVIRQLKLVLKDEGPTIEKAQGH